MNKRSTRTDDAYGRIREQILRCELEPGARFTEGHLAASVGFAKAPVREALARLVQEGLVRSIPRRGYEVNRVTVRDANELFELRLTVEPRATELAAGRIDQQTLERLNELCQAKYDPEDPVALAEYAERHREFHLLVIRACGNRKLSDVVERVLDESERLIYMGLLRRERDHQLADRHHDLVEALASGDGAAARQIAHDSIVRTQNELLEAAFRSPAVQSAALELTSLPTRSNGVGGNGAELKSAPRSRRRRADTKALRASRA